MGKSADYYKKNPEAAKKKAAYDKKYHATPARKKYRAELAQDRRDRGIMGKGGKDVSHKKGGGTTLESKRTNRARQGAGGKAKKK
tara:strand:+ start:3446 stop:3700 length:255 start_codon:yes stop_codon:yes gene_type:complete